MNSYPINEDSYQQVITLLKELCAIPAPSNYEEKRAAFCQKWLLEHGATNVTIDDALNVVFPYQCDKHEDLVVIMAHTDTVFPDLEPMPMSEEDGKLFCPGVGDDTANLAVLMTVAAYVAQNKLETNCGILFVANAGEEGLGNLKGSRQIAKDYGSRIKEFISFDGYYDHVCNHAVGSHRYKVEVLTEGGHSFAAFGNRNAIQYLSSIISTLYNIKVPQDGSSKTTYNVGSITGGTSINTIAQQASMLYEYRSDSRTCLASMKTAFEAVIEAYRSMGITVNVTLLGERPCTGDVDVDKESELSSRCQDTIARYSGKMPRLCSSSTDCNIPLSLGIPAACFGVVLGGLAHTREEWIDLESLKTGLAIGADFILQYTK